MEELGSWWVALTLAHLAATAVMVGLIWTVQIVHYPLFALVGPQTYPDYQSQHMTRISVLLAVPWGVEALTGLAVVVLAPDAALRIVGVAALALQGAVVAVTALVAAPAHEKMLDGFVPELHRRLVRSNWVRTLLWTARGGLAVVLVWWSTP